MSDKTEAPKTEPVPLTAADFESGCGNQISGWLWDSSYSEEYDEPITLTVREMRYIANVLRAAQGLKPGVVQPWSEEVSKTM